MHKGTLKFQLLIIQPLWGCHFLNYHPWVAPLAIDVEALQAYKISKF